MVEPSERQRLEHGVAMLVGDMDHSLSTDADRKVLLERKQLLSSQMEELRATMRQVQEDSERSSDEARQCEAEAALELSKVAALRDKVQTLLQQIQRSQQQALEHRRAERDLRVEMERAKGTFQEVISVEMDVQMAIRNEIGQLQQVVQDLANRIETKMSEIDRLEQANSWARAEVSGSVTRWRQRCLWRQEQLRRGLEGKDAEPRRQSPADDEAEALRLMGFCLGALKLESDGSPGKSPRGNGAAQMQKDVVRCFGAITGAKNWLMGSNMDEHSIF
ncbi:unnamed protein product [Cladocopium goreaui]|uniref:Uncharacterized protein n=1 Tax=Cladocopium goreaui TaxID=2562237 RepID=A0A9P1G7V6_9DINO|nr:unnamed protein product [Cladocopium goreaui]